MGAILHATTTLIRQVLKQRVKEATEVQSVFGDGKPVLVILDEIDGAMGGSDGAGGGHTRGGRGVDGCGHSLVVAGLELGDLGRMRVHLGMKSLWRHRNPSPSAHRSDGHIAVTGTSQ